MSLYCSWNTTWPFRLRADSRFAPSQWETLLQSNGVSHWLGTNLESALHLMWDHYYFHCTDCPSSHHKRRTGWCRLVLHNQEYPDIVIMYRIHVIETHKSHCQLLHSGCIELIKSFIIILHSIVILVTDYVGKVLFLMPNCQTLKWRTKY